MRGRSSCTASDEKLAAGSSTSATSVKVENEESKDDASLAAAGVEEGNKKDKRDGDNVEEEPGAKTVGIA